jgi:hypothetical protein
MLKSDWRCDSFSGEGKVGVYLVECNVHLILHPPAQKTDEQTSTPCHPERQKGNLYYIKAAMEVV